MVLEVEIFPVIQNNQIHIHQLIMEMILMLKGTSLASTVTLLDLTGVAKHIISTTFRPVEVFIVAGSVYLLMTFIIHNFIKILEKKLDYSK